MARKKQQQRKPWQPLVGGRPSADYLELMRTQYRRLGVPERSIEEQLPDEVWENDAYQVVVRRIRPLGLKDAVFAVGLRRPGPLHLSVHRHDRRVMRDWRHLQQIKNEVAGPERWAYETFPAESELGDTANEYHLYVLAEGDRPPFTLGSARYVLDHTVLTGERVAGRSRGRQRPFQPGLVSGAGERTPSPLDSA
jgi:hypothetical protein